MTLRLGVQTNVFSLVIVIVFVIVFVPISPAQYRRARGAGTAKCC